MRKVAVWGFVVVAVGVMFTGAQAQRIAPEPTAPVSKPAQVEVINFPAVQPVNGTVNVGNLPAVQEVAGTVSISNLPTTCPTQAHFIGYTTTGISTDSLHSPEVLAIMRQCAEEVPGTRVCNLQEYLDSIPVPPEFTSAGALLWIQINSTVGTSSLHMGCVAPSGIFADCRSDLMPQPNVVACCGY
jgi:hypothetical protein